MLLQTLYYLIALIVGVYIGAVLSYKGTAIAIKKLQDVHKEELKELFETLKGKHYGQG